MSPKPYRTHWSLVKPAEIVSKMSIQIFFCHTLISWNWGKYSLSILRASLNHIQAFSHQRLQPPHLMHQVQPEIIKEIIIIKYHSKININVIVTFIDVQILVFFRSSFQTAGRWQIKQPVKRNTHNVETSVPAHTTSRCIIWQPKL